MEALHCGCAPPPGTVARRRLLLVAWGVLVFAVAGALAGVLAKAAIDKRERQEQAATAGAAPAASGQQDGSAVAQALLPAAGSMAAQARDAQQAASPTDGAVGPAEVPANGAVAAPAAGGASPASAEAGDSRAPFYPENQQAVEQAVCLSVSPEALLVQAQDGQSLPFPFASPGPCRRLRQHSNISLDLSAAATGCRGLQCAIGLRITLPEAGNCPDFPAPYPAVYLVSGFSCVPVYYKTLVERLASWGYAVLQYDRPLGGTFQPSSETETAYFDAVMAWCNAVNRTSGRSLSGQFSNAPVGVLGHSMGGGLAAILAGIHPREVAAVVLLDPVDYTQMSLRVARKFLVQYGQPVLVVTVGVHCIDRNGCVGPQDHQPTAAEDAAWVKAGACRPNWQCCDWDDGAAGMEIKPASAIALATDGPSGFVEFAAPGSWLARLGLAGHTSFLEPGSTVFGGMQCPAAADNAAVQYYALALTTAFLDARLRGQAGAEQFALAWATAAPPQKLTVRLQPPAQRATA